ncbi:hypothetical protein GGR56DRAFT_558710 [Xylariaceae sp. FL0804]|nr:hypothetical protein GGR56DRAFT_558710 [Xylariaceae sp. FL0804]
MSTSPVKAPLTPVGTGADNSMMVELPTHLEEADGVQEDVTIKLRPHSPAQSPSRSQALKTEPSQEPGLTRVQERQRQTYTPEPQKRRSDKSDGASPGHLPPFDWEDFEYRYSKALQEADEQERQLLEEFDRLFKYFNVWASASSSHDNERAVKRFGPNPSLFILRDLSLPFLARLQTRERFVRLTERSLSQKKQHLAEVVKAFQSALALLNTT